MPIGLAARIYSALTPTSAQAWFLLVAAALLVTARVWSSSPSLTTRRILHGKTILISVSDILMYISLLKTKAKEAGTEVGALI